MKLVHQRYGKARVRVMKVTRAGSEHQLKELEIAIMLGGDFESSYTQADNHLVIPTDTMKNAVYALAKERLGAENEEFGLTLGEHFLKSYAQVNRVEIALSETGWTRMSPEVRPRPNAFIQTGAARRTALMTCSRTERIVQSGLGDLLILKTTGSGFEGYVKDEYTTLPETRDRILATKLNATWDYDKTPVSYAATNTKILEAMLTVFANTYSPSVQVTLFQMAEAALKAAPEISKIHLALPNQHCLLVNLAPFGLANANEILVPTDEPHGQIEGTVSRG